MRIRLAMWVLALGVLSVIGCSQNQQAKIRIIEPSYSYVDQTDKLTASNQNESLAQVPTINVQQP